MTQKQQEFATSVIAIFVIAGCCLSILYALSVCLIHKSHPPTTNTTNTNVNNDYH